MSPWRSFEKDFREITDPYNDLRADWSDQEDSPDHWNLAGFRSAEDRFEQIARLAGKALVLDPAIKSILPEQVMQDGDPVHRWLTALRLMTNQFKYGPVLPLHDANRRHVGDILSGTLNNVIECSALLCLRLAAEEAPSVQATSARQSSMITHSPDFRSINKRGLEYSLTSKQAQVYQILWDAYESGTPDVGQDYLLEEVSPSVKRLRDVFKSNIAAWKELIGSGNTKGTFRLKM